jgi:hypothetical protein
LSEAKKEHTTSWVGYNKWQDDSIAGKSKPRIYGVCLIGFLVLIGAKTILSLYPPGGSYDS